MIIVPKNAQRIKTITNLNMNCTINQHCFNTLVQFA